MKAAVSTCPSKRDREVRRASSNLTARERFRGFRNNVSSPTNRFTSIFEHYFTILASGWSLRSTQNCAYGTQRKSGALSNPARSNSVFLPQGKNGPNSRLWDRRSSKSLSFGPRDLKPRDGTLGYPCSLLLRQSREHRNHYVLERTGGIEPLLLVRNVIHAF
jgi:hypothetical protein